MKDTAAMLEAFIRLSCEVGYPKYVSCDKEGSLLAMMREVKVDLRDLQHRLYSEHGVLLDQCAVGGHDQHGKVERTIRSVQDSMEEMGLSKMRLHSMGLQTICKQVENALNNLPLGYKYDRDQDNTKTLKIIVPNMIKTGRINSRALDGPVKLSSDHRKMLGEIAKKYEAWYKIWCETYVPKLMHQRKGFRNDRDLAVDDLVYFQKKESELSSPWMIGRIDQIIRSRDGIIRRVIVKYSNASENIQRTTDRSVRRLIKIHSIDDPDLHCDLRELQRRIDELEDVDGDQGPTLGNNRGDLINLADLIERGSRTSSQDDQEQASKRRCTQCCCQEHCKVTIHNISGSKPHPIKLPDVMACQLGTFDVEECIPSGLDEDQLDKEVYNEPDTITALIMSVGKHMDF